MKKNKLANKKIKLLEKNKYLNKLTRKDIIAILNKCGFTLCESFTNNNGLTVPAVKRGKNKIVVRCYAPELDKDNDYLKDLYSLIYKSNPKLAYKLFMSSSLLCGLDFNYNNNKDILFVSEYAAYFPFELDEALPKSRLINEAYLTYCTEKFGEMFVKDYNKYVKNILSAKNTEKENEQESQEL